MRFSRLYAAVAAGFLALALAAVAAKGELDFIVSDGRGYYVFLPSLLIDGDLDFSDEITEHWGADFSPYLLQDITPAGRVAVRYPIGIALTLLPGFAAAHAVASAASVLLPVPAVAPDGYSVPYQLAGLATILGLGLATMVLLHRWLVHAFDFGERSAGWAVLLFWVGSPYAYYYFREPFMAHAVSTFWVTGAVVLASPHRRGGFPERHRRRAAFAFCAAMAMVCRPTNAFVLLLVPALLEPEPVGAAAGAPPPDRRAVAAAAAGYLAALLPLLAQLAVWKVLFGRWLAYSYGERGFDWTHPALLSTLASPRHGLFVWSPLLLAACAGLWVGRTGLRRRAPRVVGGLVVGALAVWYANSAWRVWWFGDAFGARAFLELAPLFVLGLAALAERIGAAGRAARTTAVAAAAAGVAYSWILMALYITHRIDRSGPLF